MDDVSYLRGSITLLEHISKLSLNSTKLREGMLLLLSLCLEMQLIYTLSFCHCSKCLPLEQSFEERRSKVGETIGGRAKR